MKRFYISIILFMLPVMLFMVEAEFTIRQIPNEYKYKKDWMEQHAEEVETLILGNSHTAEGVNPTWLGKNSFSLAIPGQPYSYCRFLFFKWISRCKHLRILIMPVSYSSFYEAEDRVDVLYYGLYMDCPYYKYDIRYSLESIYYRLFAIKISNYLKVSNVSWTPNGWIPWLLKNKSPVWNADHVNKSLARILYAKSYNEVDKNIKYVADIADYCCRHGIRLVLVSTPHTKEFNSCLDSKQIHNTYRIVRELQREYGMDFFDYRKDVRFKNDDFYDQSHLSEVGAEKFTKILMRDIQEN